MKLHSMLYTVAVLAGASLLTACDDTKGFGETKGFGGYTKQFGDADAGIDKPVGLCSYLGGCMESSEDNGPAIGPPKRRTDAGDGSPD